MKKATKHCARLLLYEINPNKGLCFFRIFFHSLELLKVFWGEGFDISSVTDNFFLSHANQTAYDSISIHGGSGFIMEYKCQRLYRDARIFSIYEGTTQLQVVAAVRYITNGTYLSIMKEMLEGELSCDCMKGLRDRVAKLVQLYEEAVEKVNASENQDVHDFLARRLYNMTADIIGSLLLIEDASKAPDLFIELNKVVQ